MSVGRILGVTLHGEPLARLHEQVGPRVSAYDLEFDRTWLDRIERPVATLAALNWRLDLVRPFVGRLPAFLTNLLPEREGALRRRITRAAGLPADDDLALLDFVGGDMGGALAAHLLTETRPSLRRRAAEASARAGDEADRLRWSLGGVQLKFSVDRAARISLPIGGRGGRWILKIPNPREANLVRAELAMLEWARLVGFAVPEAEVVDPRTVEGLPADAVKDATEALLVRRFDRLDDHTPVHMEELASVMGVQPENKYAETGKDPRASSLIEVARLVRRFAGSDGAGTFLERVVFDALVGNGDAHLKNWAFLFPDGRRPELAPVYDVCPTILFGFPAEHALPFMGERLFRAMSDDGIRRFARKLGEPSDVFVDRAHALVRRASTTFDAAMERAELPETLVAALREHFRSLPFVRRD